MSLIALFCPTLCKVSTDSLETKQFTEIEERRIDMINRRMHVKTSKPLSETQNCRRVRNHFSNGYYTTQKEADFPIAYVLTIDQSPHQVLEFLRAIYRPHNVILTQSRQRYYTMWLHALTMLSYLRSWSVYWGWHTFLDAQMRCYMGFSHYQPQNTIYVNL